MRAVPTPEQEMLRDTVRRLATSMTVNTPDDLLRLDDGANWQALAEAGLLAMRVRDEGAPLASGYDTMIAVEELAGALSPAPFVGNILALELLALAGAPEDLTGDIGGGHVRHGLMLTTDLDRVAQVGDAGAVCVDAAGADHVLAFSGLSVVRIPTTGTVAGADLTRPFASASSTGAERVGAPLTPAQLDRWTALALALVCADIVGVLRTGLRQTVAYAQTRIQYDVPIGSFQAVQHMCADMLVQTEAAASAASYAAWAVDVLDPTDSLLAARTAKAWCGAAALNVGQMLMQSYGGIGQTWEHVAHLRARRVLVDRKLFGDENHHLLHIADARLGAA